MYTIDIVCLKEVQTHLFSFEFGISQHKLNIFLLSSDVLHKVYHKYNTKIIIIIKTHSKMNI